MQQLTGQCVLVTGGTGSFGTTMTRRLLQHDIAKIKIFSRDEAKQHQMRIDFQDPRLEFHIGDVRSTRSIATAMAGVDYVFHAAALKQVPSGEFFPLEAVYTNVIGSNNVIEAACAASVGGLVCLSTDKAVLPANAMGMTKGLMEKAALAAARNNPQSLTTISSVRFGNVLYSRGSVVPLFVQQIVEGRPLTITNGEMTRFLMPLESAVDLVEFAFERAEPGDIFVRKAPAASIKTVAQALLTLFNAANPMEVIGVRHGEKLFETLATTEELQSAVDEGDYWRIKMDERGLNYDSFFNKGVDIDTASAGDYHSHSTRQLSVPETAEMLASLPEIKAHLARWSKQRPI